MKSSGDDRERAINAARAGDWNQALRILSRVGHGNDPLSANDLAVALHQNKKTPEALELLSWFKNKSNVPAVLRLNAFYMERALELDKDFDPAWRHEDMDGAAPPERPPLVSVIVRTYNRTAYLAEALASLKAQTFADYEAIVVNDGGDPAAREAVVNSGLERARYYMAPRQGPAQALNAGLAMARGKYVTGLDDDDVLLPRHLEASTSYLESPGAAPAAYTDYRVVRYEAGPEGNLVPGPARDYKWDAYEKGTFFRTNPCIINVMVKRECYEDVGKFRPYLPKAMDWEMWLRLAGKYDFHHIPELTVEVRERPGDVNLTARTASRKYYWDNLVLFLHRGLPLLSRPKDPGLEMEYVKTLLRLDAAVSERPELIEKINLRGLWDMNKPYVWPGQNARWFLDNGDAMAARLFYKMALQASPLEPKLWAGLIKARAAKAAEE